VTLPDSYAETHGSACLDGTPFAYYVKMAEVPSDKWVFFLQVRAALASPDSTHELYHSAAATITITTTTTTTTLPPPPPLPPPPGGRPLRRTGGLPQSSGEPPGLVQ
jgi:hypothetical protein